MKKTLGLKNDEYMTLKEYCSAFKKVNDGKIKLKKCAICKYFLNIKKRQTAFWKGASPAREVEDVRISLPTWTTEGTSTPKSSGGERESSLVKRVLVITCRILRLYTVNLIYMHIESSRV